MEICQVLIYDLGQISHLAFYVAEAFLYMTEQYSGSGEGDSHRAQLVQELVPLINTNLIMSAGYDG